MFIDRKAGLEPIVPNVWRISNQRAWGEEINCYLIQDDNKIILIDSPNHNPETVALVKSFGLSCEIYLTHAPASGDGHLWQKHEGIPMILHDEDLGNKWLKGEPVRTFSGDLDVTSHIKALHMPGHSPGHVMYIDTREDGSLFSGDALLKVDGEWRYELDEGAKERLGRVSYARVLPLHYTLGIAPLDGSACDREKSLFQA